MGIDAGTTSIKGMLMDNKGNIIMVDRQEYVLDTGPDDICEIDAEIYWNITCKIIKNIISRSGISAEQVSSVSFSSQGETIIPVDRHGRPLRKAIVWLDNRTRMEAEIIRKKFGEQQIMEITGQPDVLPLYPATRILWLREKEPEIFRKVEKYLLVEDYLIFRLTGRYCTEHTIVSSSLYFDISQKKWWTEMLNFIEITENQLPELLKPGTLVGNLTKEAAKTCGLNINTFCVTGAYDHAAGALGSSNFRTGDVTLTIGASMAMVATVTNRMNDLSLKLPCQCHAIDGLYFLQPYAQTAGMVLKWFKDEFCQSDSLEASQKGKDVYDLIADQAEEIPPGSGGLIMLPHLMGTGSPEFNPLATGVFAGIRMGMSKGHFVRAIIESVCLMVQHNRMIMEKKGIQVNAMIALGGATKNDLWNQTMADITGLPVSTLANNETSATGACILAGVGTGLFDNLEEASKLSVKTKTVYEPKMVNHELYDEIYKKYVYLSESMESFWNLSK